jgi:hypothetical protein
MPLVSQENITEEDHWGCKQMLSDIQLYTDRWSFCRGYDIEKAETHTAVLSERGHKRSL